MAERSQQGSWLVCWLAASTSRVRPNNSFKPNLLRSSKTVAGKACHCFASTTQVGLIQVLAATGVALSYVKAYAMAMTSLSASEARANLYRLMDQAAESHQPILISGKRSNAVLLAEEDWAAIQETLFLLSVPGMRESIKTGMLESTDTCSTELDW